MTTLRRELRLKFEEIIRQEAIFCSDGLELESPYRERIADFATLLTEAAMTVKFMVEDKPKMEREILKKSDPAWSILAGEDIDTAANIAAKEATDAFEKDFGFGTLPWNSDSTWEKFYKFVVRIYLQDKNVWRDYVAWRNDKGKYVAYSNRKIREAPQAFMDTGYPEFEASKMYADSPAKSKTGRKFQRLNS